MPSPMLALRVWPEHRRKELVACACGRRPVVMGVMVDQWGRGPYWYVSCPHCKRRGPNDSNRARAVAVWNQRRAVLPPPIPARPRWRVSLKRAWYDLWVGAYYDRARRALYLCPLPTVVLKIERS